MKKTLRLKFPEWQGGENPNYYQGCQLLDWLAPKNDGMECAEVPVRTNFTDRKSVINGISWRDELIGQQKAAYAICEEKDPDRIIVLGGDCSVEQAPFDYLHGKYPEGTGVIWIDAHPDFSTPRDVSHEHAMVLGNLMGDGAPELAELMRHPFDKEDIVYVGIIPDHLEPWEEVHQKKYRMKFLSAEDVKDGSAPVLDWIREHQYRQVLIHWDLDVLSPDDFQSLLCAEPYIPPVHYAIGKMRLERVIQIIRDIEEVTDVAALGITEFMPWDVMRLRRGLEELDIFRS